MWQNAELLRIVEQLNNEGDASAAESDSLDNAAWSEHDAPLFPLAESEFDNYWNSFDPFESAADTHDQCRVTGTTNGQQAAVKRQLSSLSPPPQQQSVVYSPVTKRSRDNGTSPVLLDCCGEEAQHSPEDTFHSSSFDVECQRTTTPGVIYEDSVVKSSHSHHSPVTDADVALSSPSSVDIPFGLLSSLPPNCSVYITHQPASNFGEKPPPPVTQIVINHARARSTLSPRSHTLHHRPSYCMPSPLPPPSLPLSPRVPPPSTTLNQFHPLDDVRLREPTPSCRNKALPATVVRPPRSLTTYAAEFRHLEVGVDDVSRRNLETARRASDSATATAASSLFTDSSSRRSSAHRCRHHSSTFLQTSEATSPVTGVTSSLTSTLVVRPSANKFQRPTSLSLPPSTTLPSVFRHHCREPPSCGAHLDLPSQPSSWQRGSVECAVQSKTTPTTNTWPAPRTPDDETDGNSNSGLPHSCLEDMNADSSSSGNSGADDAPFLLSNALHRFCSSRSSPPFSLVEGTDSLAELPSPVLSTAVASAKPCQRTIDALSKKIQRNRTRKVDKPLTVVSKETLVSSVARPDSSCPTPPQSRQLTSSLSSSSATLSPSDPSEALAASGYSKFCQHEVLPKNEYADGDNKNKGDLSTTNHGNSSTLAKDPMLPAKRKRTGRRKSQTHRTLSADGVEKVIIIHNLYRDT